MRELTDEEDRAFVWILAFIGTEKKSPLIGQVRAAMKMSAIGVSFLLASLEKRGALKIARDTGRGIEIL